MYFQQQSMLSLIPCGAVEYEWHPRVVPLRQIGSCSRVSIIGSGLSSSPGWVGASITTKTSLGEVSPPGPAQLISGEGSSCVPLQPKLTAGVELGPHWQVRGSGKGINGIYYSCNVSPDTWSNNLFSTFPILFQPYFSYFLLLKIFPHLFIIVSNQF